MDGGSSGCNGTEIGVEVSENRDLLECTVMVPSWCVLSALEYALGRHTYIVELTVELVKKIWRDLESGTRETVRRRVKDYLLQSSMNLHDDLDLQSWRDLWAWMEDGN